MDTHPCLTADAREYVLEEAGSWNPSRGTPSLRSSWWIQELPSCQPRISAGSHGIVHFVPPPLRHVPCMWLEEGDESRPCRRMPAWTMGASSSRPRVYCEHHGRLIFARGSSAQPREEERAALAIADVRGNVPGS